MTAKSRPKAEDATHAARKRPTKSVGVYPKGPFKKQPQPWPGLASEMKPLPDHGEKSYQGSGKMLGRKALITGGDSGIGRAVAIAFAREGADVAINYLPDEEKDAQQVIEMIKAEGRVAVAIPGDLRKESFCKSLVERAVKKLGGLDTLVNVAGRQQFCEDICDLSTDAFDWTLKTNLYALFWVIKSAVPHMPPESVIINTGSTISFDPSPILFDYGLTKAAIVNMTKSLAKQLAARSIRVNCVAPGPFWTPLQVCGGQPMENVVKFGEETVIGRPGQPAEIAPCYVLLASREGSYLTGQTFGITGGNGLPG